MQRWFPVVGGHNLELGLYESGGRTQTTNFDDLINDLTTPRRRWWFHLTGNNLAAGGEFRPLVFTVGARQRLGHRGKKLNENLLWMMTGCRVTDNVIYYLWSCKWEVWRAQCSIIRVSIAASTLRYWYSGWIMISLMLLWFLTGITTFLYAVKSNNLLNNSFTLLSQLDLKLSFQIL